MTKKDFIALADCLMDTTCCTESNGKPCAPFTDGQLGHIADFCASQNPRFMRDHWLGYIAGECGPNGDTIK